MNIKKVVVNTDSTSIIFSYKIEDPDFIDISDYTNIIDNSNLVFNEKYIINNKEIISYFLKGIISEKNLNTIVINDYELVGTTLDIIQNIKNLTSLYITPNEKLEFEICDKITNNKNLTYINCYDMPEFMFEKINQTQNIKIDLRCEIFSVSNFISENKLTTFSSIYYKENININKIMDSNDIDDFETFCKINRKLRQITINYYFIGDIKKIVEMLKKNNICNVRIQISTDDKNFNNVEESIAYLKTLNKRLRKKYNIKIKIRYTNDYKKDKYVKQWNINNLKLCGGILAIIATLSLGFIGYYNYTNDKTVDDIKEVAKKDNKPTQVNHDTGVEVNEDEITSETPLTKDFESLRTINSDTVGWLTVNNTSVDYPVVQASDNDYYLKRSFYKKVNGAGWIYMDYRNSIENLNNNTVIYGHNMRGTSKLMFTTLEKYAKQENWYTNPKNQIIKFDTINASMNWQIFSIYVAEPDTNVDNYTQTKFATEKIFQDFLDLQKSKSIYDFNVEVTSNDKILTLTTCTEKGTKRLVVQAKLIQ